MSKKIIQISARLGDTFKAFSRVKSEQARPLGYILYGAAGAMTSGRKGIYFEAPGMRDSHN